LAGSPSQVTGFIQSISLPFDTSFDYGLSTAREDVTPMPLTVAFMTTLYRRRTLPAEP
jgi:hypothetical protein